MSGTTWVLVARGRIGGGFGLVFVPSIPKDLRGDDRIWSDSGDLFFTTQAGQMGASQAVQDIQATDDAAEYGVPAVEIGRRTEANKKL
jgi:hypothetical protein